MDSPLTPLTHTAKFNVKPYELHTLIKTIQRKLETYCMKYSHPQRGIIIHWSSNPIHMRMGSLNKSTGSIEMEITFAVRYYFPQIGSIVPTFLQHQYDQGLFLSLMGRIKIFAPIEKCNVPFHDKNRIPVRILETQYRNNSIACIGEIV